VSSSAGQRPGRLIILSGPSGVGKDTVIRRLLEIAPELRRPVAFTTRAPRPGEVDGRDYSFVGEPEFLAMRDAGQFLETAVVHGNRYGTARARVDELRRQGQDVLLKIDVQGAAQLRQQGLDGCFIFLAPPSPDVLRARLRRRQTESPEELAVRTHDAETEMAEAANYHHVVVNDQVERAAAEIAQIVRSWPG
jgi:guanylate kinase